MTFLSRDDGAAGIEYTFLAALIAMAAVLSITFLGEAVTKRFWQFALALT